MYKLARILGLGLFFAMQALALEPDQAELERWLDSDDDLPPSVATRDVNEGELVFLQHPPARPVHHHHNTLLIDEASLVNGWVYLQQCHNNLDQVPRTQILYNRDRVRDLQVISSRHIGRSWIEDNTVQLADIGVDAEVCVSARTHALQMNADGSYSLRNGPFMRRFLDGYYPMQVSIDIDFSETPLQLVAMKPVRQEGFEVQQEKGYVAINAWFEGRLKTEFQFTLLQSP